VNPVEQMASVWHPWAYRAGRRKRQRIQEDLVASGSIAERQLISIGCL
jgi:hypothetical protein